MYKKILMASLLTLGLAGQAHSGWQNPDESYLEKSTLLKTKMILSWIARSLKRERQTEANFLPSSLQEDVHPELIILRQEIRDETRKEVAKLERLQKIYRNHLELLQNAEQ